MEIGTGRERDREVDMGKKTNREGNTWSLAGCSFAGLSGVLGFVVRTQHINVK